MMTNNNQSNPTKAELKRQELEEARKNAVTDEMTQRTIIKTEKGTLLNDQFLGRKKQTLKMFKVPVASFERPVADGPFKKRLHFIKLAESRLTRFFESNEIIEEKLKEVPLNNGEVINVLSEYSYNELVGCPIIFVEYVGKPMGPDIFQDQAYQECMTIIKDGLNWKYKGETIATEYAQSSASEMRTLKGVHIRKDYKFSDSYLAKFKCPNSEDPAEVTAFDEFMTTMRSLRGAEVLYTAMSYGAYLLQYKGKEESEAKFMARMGMAQTSSKSLGNDYRVKCIGEVKIEWTEALEVKFNEYYLNLKKKDGTQLLSVKRIEKMVNKIKELWKQEKVDGQNIIRASAVIRGFKKLGIKLKRDDVTGKLIQLRWAGVKGTALVIPDEWLDDATLPDGSHPYAGYDMIVEKSSWKYSPWIKYWTGELAPELELVAMSKTKYSNNMNYQFMLALDGDGNREIKTVEKIKQLIDARYAFLNEAMHNAEIAKAALGVKSNRDIDLDDVVDIDDYEKSLTTILAKALDACDDIIYDRSWRNKFINRATKMKEKIGYGKIPVEGANRFVISDPTPFFRTDLATPRKNKKGEIELDYEGNPMFDIIITSMDQCAIQDVASCYWSDNKGEAVLFRSPCVHPGEPQRVNLAALETIPEIITAGENVLDIRELFSSIKDIVVINVFSSILDCLGGADTDGDTVLVVTQPEIVELRSFMRAPMLIKVESKTKKAVINPVNVKAYMARSLEDAGIGRITNWATTWRDIELMVIHMPDPISGKYRLPSNVKSALLDLAKKARSILKTEASSMNEVELASLAATAEISDINDDSKYQEWTRKLVMACEANLELTRYLQEMSINTAKSGDFVEFAKYGWLKLKIRASWHRPLADNKYDSWSTMGQVSSYAEDKWDTLKEKAAETSKTIPIGADLDWTELKEVYRAIRELKASYGTAIHNLRPKYNEETGEYEVMDDDERRLAFKEVGIYFNNILRRMAVELGSVDAISAMVYRATHDRDKDTDEGLSFVWSCWGEEFVHTLKHMNSGKSSKKLVSVRMMKEYEDFILPAGEYLVEDRTIRFKDHPETPVAHVGAADGTYEIINFGETAYLLVEKARKTVESMAATFNGTKIKLIGYRHQIYEGQAMTRDKVKELLGLGGYVITVMGGETHGSEGKTFVDALIYTTINGEQVCIGNIPGSGSKNDESGYYAQALHDKVIRVIIPRDADKLDMGKTSMNNRLTLEIAEILEDLAK